jgi:hypothetical protein
VLTRALIDERLLDDGSATVCYFFFKDNEEQNNTAKAICALLHQIFCAKMELFKRYAIKAVELHGDGLKSDFHALWQLLLSATNDASSANVICILDAIDECQQPDRGYFIKELKDFYVSSRESVGAETKLKFLVTSRPYRDIELEFRDLSKRFSNIRIAGEEEWKAISDEIRVVIDAKVEEMDYFSDNVRATLKHRLSNVTHTTYLWLYLVLEEIKQEPGRTEKKLLRAISVLPATVEEAYEKILKKCKKRNEQNAKRLLEIIVAAKRPLGLDEMDVVLEVQIDSRSCSDLDLEGSKARNDWIRDTCGLFVRIQDNRIYLIHQTAREFLLTKEHELQQPRGWKSSLDIRHAHLNLAKACISYLLLEEFQEGLHRFSRMEWRQEHAFLNYSANHWALHVRNAIGANCLHGDGLDNGWIRKVLHLCEVGNGSSSVWFHHSRWQPLRRLDLESLTWVGAPPEPSLFWATKFELPHVVQFLLKESNTIITDEMIELAAASQESGDRLTEIFLEQGVRITKKAVQAAAANESCGQAIITLLLDRRGGDVTITEDVVRAVATNRSSGDVIMTLLLNRRGDEVKITAGVVRAVAANSQKGNDIMIIILNRKEDVKLTEQVMIEIVRTFNIGMIQRLLDRRGDEVKITSGIVQAAAGRGPSGADIMTLLLDERGHEVEITQAVVQAAAMNKAGIDVITRLLNRREDVEITGQVVVEIIQRFNTVVVQTLLSQRADKVNITTAIVRAAAANWQSGNAIMMLLLHQKEVKAEMDEQLVIEILQRFDENVAEALLDRAGVEIQVTRDVVKLVAANWQSRNAVEALYLRRNGDVTGICEAPSSMDAAFANQKSANAIMKLLLSQKGDMVEVTEQLVIDIIRRFDIGVIQTLLDRKGNTIKITEAMVEAATANGLEENAIMELLLNLDQKRG